MTTPSPTTRAVDVHALPAMLTALRLPSVHRHWPALAERADKEGWPAARFLAALAEVEIAERETRRIRRHLIEVPPAGRQDARDLRLQGPAQRSPRPRRGARRRRLGRDRRQPDRHRQQRRRQDPSPLRRRSRPRRSRSPRPLHPHHRSRAEAPGRPARPRPRGRARQARPLRPDHPRRHRLRPEGPGRDLRPLQAHRPALRDPKPRHRRQPALQRLGPHLPRQGRHRRRHRQARPPRDHPRDERRQLPTPRRRRPHAPQGRRPQRQPLATTSPTAIITPTATTSPTTSGRTSQPESNRRGGHHRPTWLSVADIEVDALQAALRDSPVKRGDEYRLV